MEISVLQKERYNYKPKMPKMASQPPIAFIRAWASAQNSKGKCSTNTSRVIGKPENTINYRGNITTTGIRDCFRQVSPTTIVFP